jgi:hypothetical protein
MLRGLRSVWNRISGRFQNAIVAVLAIPLFSSHWVLERWRLDWIPAVALLVTFTFMLVRFSRPVPASNKSDRQAWLIALRWWIVLIAPMLLVVAWPVGGLIEWLILLPAIGGIFLGFRFMNRDLTRRFESMVRERS